MKVVAVIWFMVCWFALYSLLYKVAFAKAPYEVQTRTENIYEEENAGRFVNSGDPGPNE